MTTMKFIRLSSLVCFSLHLAIADDVSRALRSSLSSSLSSNVNGTVNVSTTIKPECLKNTDCPTIYCITTPCPVNVCQNNKCIAVTPDVDPNNPECWNDSDCPKLACRGINPCPINVCHRNVCVTKIPSNTSKSPATKKPVSGTKKPRVPSTWKPRTPSTWKPRTPSTWKPRTPSTWKPRSPSTRKPRSPSTWKPRSPSTRKPRLPSTWKPRVPATKKPRLPVTRAPVSRFDTVVKCGKNTCQVDEQCCNESCGICTKPGNSCHKMKCVDIDPKQCGQYICGVDEECCNPSCGICTKKGGVCNMIACVDPDPVCQSDSDCPMPSCAPPVDGVTDSCPITKCDGGQCIYVPKDSYCDDVKQCPIPSCPMPGNGIPSDCPMPKCIKHQCTFDTPPGYCDNVLQCPTPSCPAPVDDTQIVNCPIAKCIDNSCALVSPPKPGMCYDVDDCPIPSCPAPQDGLPVSCPFPKCLDNKCIFEIPPQPTKCGNVMCNGDEYCCNKSCGICLNKNSKVKCPTNVCDPAVQCRFDLECKPGTICDINGQCVEKAPVKCGNVMCTGDQFCCNESCGDCIYIWEKRLCSNQVCTPAVQCHTDTDCKDGMVCDSQAQCVENTGQQGSKCGNVMCTADEYCCNESCGDCINKMMGRPCSNTVCSPVVQCRVDTDCKQDLTCSNGQCVEKKTLTSVPCGSNTCTNGDVCCNELCGICTEPGKSCIMGCSAGSDAVLNNTMSTSP